MGFLDRTLGLLNPSKGLKPLEGWGYETHRPLKPQYVVHAKRLMKLQKSGFAVETPPQYLKPLEGWKYQPVFFKI